MRKKKPYGENLRQQLRASARDQLYQFLLDYGSVRGALLHGTRIVNEMRNNHELGPLETLILGQAYLAAGLMSDNLKTPDRLRLKVECSGPVRGFSVEANAFGEVRGYLFQNPIAPDVSGQSRSLAALFGEGILSVTRHLADAKQPFTGQVRLEYGTLAEDLANFFLVSEQMPTAFNLSIRFDKRREVIGAGGLFLQTMPEAEPETVANVEILMQNLPSLGERFAAGQYPEAFLREWFEPFSPLVLGKRRMAFMCHCNKRRFGRFLSVLPADELADMLEKGPLPVVTTCLNCNTAYSFSREEIEQMYRSSGGE